MSTIPYFLKNPALDQDAMPQLQRVELAPQKPVPQKIAHTLEVADHLGGPVAPAPVPADPMADYEQSQAAAPMAKVPQPDAGPGAPDPMQIIQQHQLQRLQRDYDKDTNPYGSAQNHPGVFGKIAHALSVAAGYPNLRQQEEQGFEKELSGTVGEQAKNRESAATAGHLEAETPEVGPNAESTRALQGAQGKNLESETRDRDMNTSYGPSLAVAYAHRVNQVLQEGGDPAQDAVANHLQDAITGLQKQPVDTTGTKTATFIPPGGTKPTEFQWNPETKKYDIPLGEHYERPININTAAGERADRNEVLKAYAPTQQSAERMNVMTDAYEKAIKDHDQQAMLNLLANHLGMTMGLQKGARMTKDIIHEAEISRPWLQGMTAKFDKDGYLSGVNLTPPQMRQMVNLAQQRYLEDAKSSRATAQYIGAKDDGPARVPGAATIRYYKALAGGDGAKAKELAKADGWTVE